MPRYKLWVSMAAMLTAAAMLMASTLCGQQIVSVWQGTSTSSPEQRRVMIQVSKAANGGLTVTNAFVEFVPDAIHIDTSTVDAATLKFSINRGKGVYEGKKNAVGSYDGVWTWDKQTSPLTLRLTPQTGAWKVPFQYQYHYMNVTYPRPSRDEVKIPFSPRLAVEYMEEGAVAWTAEWKCVACHTNGTYMVVRPMLSPQLGAPQAKLREFFIATLHDALAIDPAKRQSEVEPTQIVYVAAGLAIWEARTCSTTSPPRPPRLCSSCLSCSVQPAIGPSKTTTIRHWNPAPSSLQLWRQERLRMLRDG